ncbi:MAG TPA: glycosyltransferase family 39 protein [Acidimicrobiales bacterium]|nr:glycosyltransferase family 39 protein [Acidimicrobiales bacterium]
MHLHARVQRVPRAWLPWIALTGLAIGAYVLSIFMARSLFPLGSANLDDAMYRYFADLLRDGRFRLPPADDAFRPWASGYSGNRIVMIYEPPWPSMLAFADLVFGTKRAALGLTAAAGVVLIALLGREMFGRWRYGLVAAVCLTLTPLFAFQTGLTLAYNFQLALTLAVLLLAMVGVRRESATHFVAMGFMWGVAFWARPYDGAILALALAPWLLFGRRRTKRAALRRLLFVGAGTVLPIAMFAVYTTATLGTPFRTHFSVLGSNNRPGYGLRGIATGTEQPFGFRDGLGATGANMKWMLGWMFGGALALPLVVWGAVLAFRRSRSAYVLVGLAVTLVVAYTAFWSPHAIVYGWPGVVYFGPFYHLALLIPIALFTALGIVELFSRHRALGWAALAILVVATGAGLSPKVRPNREVTEAFEQRAAGLEALQVDRGIVFLEGRSVSGWSGLVPFLQNTPAVDGRYVVAQDNGTGNFDVLDRFPDRTPIMFQTVFDPSEPFLVRYDAQRMSVDQGPEASAMIEVTDIEGGHRVAAYARLDDGGVYEQLLTESSPPGFRHTVSWRLTARDQEGDNVVPLTEDGSVELGVTLDADDDKGSNSEHKLVYSYRVRDERVQLLRPARPWQRTTEQPFWFPDVSATMVDLTAPR